jgi:hypothetical protein
MPTARNTALAGINSKSRRIRPNCTSYVGSAAYGVLDMTESLTEIYVKDKLGGSDQLS